MCMHPWFFSIGRLHLGQGLELARIQFMFSLSALFFCTHLRAGGEHGDRGEGCSRNANLKRCANRERILRRRSLWSNHRTDIRVLSAICPRYVRTSSVICP